MPPPNVPGPLAEWPQRALGIVIDLAIIWVPSVIVYIIGGAIGGAIGVLLDPDRVALRPCWLGLLCHPGRQHWGVTRHADRRAQMCRISKRVSRSALEWALSAP